MNKRTYTLDAATSELTLWTYKEGLLSRVAHDLCFRASDVEAEVEREGDSISVRVGVPVAGLRLAGQVKKGRVKALSSKDQAEIEANLAGPKILDAERFPKITYEGRGTAGSTNATAQGDLTLKDRTRPLAVRAQLTAEGEVLRAVGEVRVVQSTFGVQPFSALMGALRDKDEVRVSWDLRFHEAIVGP